MGQSLKAKPKYTKSPSFITITVVLSMAPPFLLSAATVVIEHFEVLIGKAKAIIK
jgi:hypothetical protein